MTSDAKTTGFKTADLYDEFGDRLQVCAPGLGDFGGRRAFAGPVETVRCHEDNSRVRECVARPGNGRVLVVDGGGSLRCALLGDILAQKAVDNGWSGVIIHGCIRDAADIAAMPLGVKALATIPRKSIRLDRGETGIPISFLGVDFFPGDQLYADEDGIVVLPPPNS